MGLSSVRFYGVFFYISVVYGAKLYPLNHRQRHSNGCISQLRKHMAKSLSERIAARSATKIPSQSAKNRALFLALRSDIKQALDDGWPVKSIWETLQAEGKIACSYQAFRGYKNRLLAVPPAQLATPSPKQANAAKRAVSKTAKTPNIPSGFTFNPIPNKEDLL
jgi:hypothetical protein